VLSTVPLINIVNSLLNKAITDREFQLSAEGRFSSFGDASDPKENFETNFSLQARIEKINLNDPTPLLSLEEVL
jgi:hypothetical protein